MTDHLQITTGSMVPQHVGELGRRLAEATRRRADQLCEAITGDVPVRSQDVLTEINATARYLETHLGGLGESLAGRRPICAEDERAALLLPSNIMASGIRTITELMIGGNRVLARMTSRAVRTSAVVQQIFDDVVPGLVVIDRAATGPQFVDLVLTDPSIRFALVFGGEQLGDDLLRRAREGVRKRIVFEGPGKDPILVLEGADVEEAARISARTKLAVAGQRCVAPENVIVQRSLHDRLVELLVEKFEAARAGAPDDPTSAMGPVISPKVPPTVRAQLADAQRKGARIACGGRVEGQLVEPTIVVGATPEMAVFQDETFAPLLAVASCDTPQEAVEIAGAGRFGLACSVYGDRAQEVAAQLRGEPYAHRVDDLVFGRYGHVTINDGLRGAAVRGLFGGYGKSGWIWDGDGLRQGPKSAAFEATRPVSARD